MVEQITRRDAGLRAVAALGLPFTPEMSMTEPFSIRYPETAFEDLRRRLRATRFPNAVTEDWSMGTQLAFERRLVTAWAEAYPWPQRQARLNRLPHRRATVDGFGVHFLHFRSSAPGAIPLLLMNGWPSSFVEYGKLAPLLSRGPTAFDVVIPALPGFGFSDQPSAPYAVEPAELFPKLMTQLGYRRFFASGADIGAGVATRIGLAHPERLWGIHISAVAEKPRTETSPPLSAAERAYYAADEVWERDEGGYQAIQGSRPQTLAFGLSDSPAGLAAWIVEKFRAWSDCGGDVLSVFPMEVLLDNLMVYWISGSIASSVRYYYESQRLRPPMRASDFVKVPTSVAAWPHDLGVPPRELAARLYNVTRYTRFPRGGHFPAWEAPELYAEDLRAFARETLAASSPGQARL